MTKKINFRQPKYILPAILYLPLLGTGYFMIDLFQTDVAETKDSNLQTTEYLNADLPDANVSSEIGSKRKNMHDAFGNINDYSAIENIDNDRDSVNKKEDFDSKYSEDEKRRVAAQMAQSEELKRLKAENERLLAMQRGQGVNRNDLNSPMSDEERRRILNQRRNDIYGDLDRDLGNNRRSGKGGGTTDGDEESTSREVAEAKEKIEHPQRKGSVHELSEDAKDQTVVKKAKDESDYFHTLSSNAPESNLIKAIIDQEIKAVTGSRVRLRLLDDIEINEVTLKKGTYLYAVIGSFSQQRVKGKVESVLIGDQLVKIGLSIYDVADGMEGLYVPESAFRETSKDIGSSALQSGTNITESGSGKNNVAQWANQALQNAYQRTTSAISKAIKKNRVRLKYGTQVYLINSSSKGKRQ